MNQPLTSKPRFIVIFSFMSLLIFMKLIMGKSLFYIKLFVLERVPGTKSLKNIVQMAV